MRPARVTFLGTGTSHGVPMIGCACAVCRSADPRDRRLRPSIYLDVEHGPAILVDTATDLRQQALTHGVTRVDALLFTHSHADHVMGLDEVRRFNVLMGGPLPVFADAATAAELRRVFAYAFTPPMAKGGGVPQLALSAITGPFDAVGLPVVPVPLLHGTLPILGFRFGRFAYLTDCSAIPEPSFALLHGLDVLVVDALRHRPHPTHFTIAEATAAARRIGATQTYFTHICHDLPHAQTTANLPAGVALAHDGLVLEVDVAPPRSPGPA
jgi:phosphoribosyl 1,2-cyclic phosphate phosphodiesterase